MKKIQSMFKNIGKNIIVSLIFIGIFLKAMSQQTVDK